MKYACSNSKEMSRCWLCEYNKDKEAVKMAKFLNENAPSMGTDQLAQAISEHLEDVDPNGEGHTVAEVKEHILLHVVTPTVRVSSLLRSMVVLLYRLEGSLMNAADDDTTMIDAKNVAIYLKVVSEIMSLYRTGDCSKLTFADSQGK